MTINISLLMDNPLSWFVPYAEQLETELLERGHSVVRINQAEDLGEGDCAFFLSCEQIIPQRLLNRHSHNIVIHASDLPKGKGWSPLTWQIVEGMNEIPLTLFEAAESVDSGQIYVQSMIHLEGHELIDEIREISGQAIVDLALKFIDSYPNIIGKPQQGEETFYKRRSLKDSELDPSCSLTELFNQLRVADNERYPAFFRHLGHTYVLRIDKADEVGRIEKSQ